MGSPESFSQQTQPSDHSPQAAGDRKTMRTVRVGFYPFEGFHMYDQQGKRSGYGYDYLQKLRDYTNWKYEYSDPKFEWPEMLNMLRGGKVDLVPGVSKTAERETEFAFSKDPICQTAAVLTVKAGNSRFRTKDYANWNGIRVGLLKNSTQNDAFLNFSKEKGFTFQSVWFDKLTDLTDALQKGKTIDAALTSSLRAIGGDEWIRAQFNESFMYIAVRKNDQSLLNELDQGMEQLDSFLPDFQKQLRRTYYMHEKSGIVPFSRPESDFIEEMKKSDRLFTVIMNPDRKPFSWFENGEYHGIFKDYADEIARRSGLKFRFLPVKTRTEYYEKRFSPEVDIVFDLLLDYQKAEASRVKLTQPYFSASVSKLRDKRVGNIIKTVSILEFGDLKERVCQVLPADLKINYCESLSEMVNEVKSASSDAAYLFTRSAEYAVYEDEENRLVSEYIPSLETRFTIGVREDLDPRLLSALNRTVLSFDSTFADQMRIKYAPKFKEVFSLRMFLQQYPFWAIVFPFLFLLAICIVLISLLMVRNRHRKELQITAMKWKAASEIAKLHPFQMHIESRRLIGDLDQFDNFWPVENGIAAHARDWACPEDAPKLEKAHSDFASGKSDHFWVTYRAEKEGKSRYFVCYAVRDASDPELMVGIIHDITDMKAVELQRDAVQRLWEKVVDNAPVMMFIKSEADDFRYVQCNKNFAEFLGRTPKEVIGHADPELFQRPQDTEAFRKRDFLVMESDEPQKFQETVENSKGERRHIQTVKMPLEDANGRFLIGLATDVTDLQNSRDEARRHEEIFRLTIQSIGDGVMTTDAEGTVQLLNPAAEQLIGLKSGEAKGKPHEEIFRIVSALDGKTVVSPLRKALEAGEVVELGNHTDLLSFDGSRYHIADCAGPIRNANGEIIGAVLIFRNVTNEYRQREELRASVALWDVTSEIMKLAPFRMHIPTREIFGNLERLNCYWPIVNGHALLPNECVYSEDLPQVNEEYVKFTAGETDSFLITYRVLHEGQIRYYRRYAIRDPHDRDIMIGIVQDITVDKELELDRNASHALWEQVVEAMPILMFVKSADDDFQYTQCNNNFAEFIGRKKEDIIGHTDLEFFPDVKEKEHFRNWDSKIMEEGRVQEFYEEAQGANKYYHFQTVKMPFTDAKGKRLLIGLSVDISGYKKAEEERNAAQLLLNNAFAAMPVILYIKAADNDFRYVQCNENFCKLFGKTEKEILGRTDAEIFPNNQEVASFHDTDLEAMNSGKPLEIVETLSGADGKTYHFRAVKMAAADIDGKPILVGMSVDITEMVQQREQMNASKLQLEAGCFMSRSFTFELDRDHNITSTNGLYKELVPHVNGKPLPPEQWVLSDDLKKTQGKIKTFFEKGWSAVTINFATDWFGKRRHYKSILKNENGRVFGVTSDVTELLETAEAVKSNALMWKQVMDELPVRFFVKDADNDCRYIMCNKANADFLGLTEEAVIGRTTEEISKPSPEITAYLRAERQILVDLQVSRTRVNIPDPQGVIREMEKIEMPIIGAGKRTLLVSIAFDITEREQSLRLAEISARILAGVVGEPDFSKVLDYIGKTAIDVLQARRVIFAKCDEEGKLHFLQDTGIDPDYHFDKEAIALHEHYWNCYLDRLIRNELVFFERMGDDVSMEPLFKIYPEYRNMALVGTPVVSNGKLHGIMIITFSKPHVFTDDDIRTLRAIGNCIMIAENRSQQNEALLLAQQEQAYRLAERTALNDCLSLFMGSGYMEIPFEEILEKIRVHLGASRCYVLRVDPEAHLQLCLAEANLDKKQSFLKNRPPFPFEHDVLWYTELKEKSLVGWKDLSDPEARARFDESWAQMASDHNIRSLWVATVDANQEIWGTLGVVYDDQSPKTFNEKDESFVRSAAKVVSMILTRAQHRNDLMSSLDTQLNLTNCLRHMVGDEEESAAMRNLLNIVRKHAKSDAAFMTELHELPDSDLFSGTLTLDDHCKNQDIKDVAFGPNEEWYLRFKQDKPLFIQNTSEIDANKILGSWAFLLKQDPPVQSYYEIPIYCNSALWGSIGILYTKMATPLSQNCKDFLMNAKKFFEILLARMENTKQLRPKRPKRPRAFSSLP
ncbi:MAG: PAS domain-containing protein [Planctomycetia bacterium]|nr:PAS domain-containing protein [Planctomycetia bacterium]